MRLSNAILITAAIFAGLMAGLFYSYSCSVVPGLALVPDSDYIAAMQSINSAIQNPVFFTVFFGILLLLPLGTYLNYSKTTTRFRFLLAAVIIYFIGAFGITVFGNIPLNNALEKFDLIHASKESIYLQRRSFEIPWKNFNIIRTLSSLLAFVLVIVACMYPGKNQHFI